MTIRKPIESANQQTTENVPSNSVRSSQSTAIKKLEISDDQQQHATVSSTKTSHSSNSSESTIVTDASCFAEAFTENYRVNSHEICAECEECLLFHRNQHLLASSLPRGGYAPFPPQWYYLLGADSKKFGKHRHTHFRKDCRTCREIVQDTFEQYYLQQKNMIPLNATSHQSLMMNPMPRFAPDFTSPSASRPSCGHSCLKFAILFYCSIAVILSICLICYLTGLFGLMKNDDFGLIAFESANSNENILNDSTVNKPTIEKLGIQVIGVVIAVVIMIIFFTGLMGSLMEWTLCLRIFGAILSYFFLITFGLSLYIIILMIISHLSLKLILSTVSCAAIGLTIHAILAILPLAFADLIAEQTKSAFDAQNTSTYFKYPSVRLIPSNDAELNQQLKRGRSYFGLGSFGRNWTGFRTSKPSVLPVHQKTSLKVADDRFSATDLALFDDSFERDLKHATLPPSPPSESFNEINSEKIRENGV